jgi:hypothetical protein
VLPGQDSHISKEVVTDECGAMAAWWLSRKTEATLRFACCSVAECEVSQ